MPHDVEPDVSYAAYSSLSDNTNLSTEFTQWYALNKSDLSGLNEVVEDLVYKHFGGDANRDV